MEPQARWAAGPEATTAGCRLTGFSFPMITSPSLADDRDLSFGTMSEHPHLGNAPIREALIDFRVRLPSDSSPENLSTLAEEMRAQYPKVGPIHQFQGEIQLGGEGPVSVRKGPQLLGYRLDSADGLNVAQVRIDGFTFSRLTPYESWDRMVEDAWVVWKRTWQRRGRSVSNGSQPGSSIASSFHPPGNSQRCFVRRSLPADTETLRRLLPRLRDAKNRIFFRSLTPEAIERFK